MFSVTTHKTQPPPPPFLLLSLNPSTVPSETPCNEGSLYLLTLKPCQPLGRLSSDIRSAFPLLSCVGCREGGSLKPYSGSPPLNLTTSHTSLRVPLPRLHAASAPTSLSSLHVFHGVCRGTSKSENSSSLHGCLLS